jgi:hypothetical protein
MHIVADVDSLRTGTDDALGVDSDMIANEDMFRPYEHSLAADLHIAADLPEPHIFKLISGIIHPLQT